MESNIDSSASNFTLLSISVLAPTDHVREKKNMP